MPAYKHDLQSAFGKRACELEKNTKTLADGDRLLQDWFRPVRPQTGGRLRIFITWLRASAGWACRGF